MCVIDDLKNRKETIWINPNLISTDPSSRINGYNFVYVKAAQNRLIRFMPYIASAFPETKDRMGNIESNLIPIPKMKDLLNANGANIKGAVYLKDDARLPIAGSIKARGGIHEVLKIAETLATEAGMMTPTDNHAIMDSEEFRNFFGQYTIQVGSTGNLGLSIGKMAARLGFKAIVHMSSDAKPWKIQMLKEAGAIVKTYDGDYSQAVARGREESEVDPKSFFVDDENSEDLFFGYATAALRTKVQLFKAGVTVDQTHPLFLYLPCGVGGAPGGITFGMRLLLGDNVHCFFAEPVEAPCFTLGMASGEHDKICVQDIGLSGKTIADGLAVGRASGFVCRMMDGLAAGAYTVADERLPEYQKAIRELYDLKIEPSGCAGFAGLYQNGLAGNGFEDYVKAHGLEAYMDQATHVVWATGGGLMPEA